MSEQALRYNSVSAILHWIIAALVLTLLVLAVFDEPIEEALGLESSIVLHKSLGMTVFVLAVLRLLWRLGHRPPPLPESTPDWQRKTSGVVHFLFYVLMLGLPIGGYVFGSGGPYPMQWFGIDIPKAPVGEAMADLAHEAHEIGGWLMIALVSLHVGAAFWHQFVQKDNLIARMRPH